MNDKIRNHINVIFAAAPQTVKAAEMKEELLTNLNDKYEDLLKSGYDSTAAFHIALSGIGDVDELFQACRNDCVTTFQPEPVTYGNTVNMDTTTKRSSAIPLLLAWAVGLIIFAPACIVFFRTPHLDVFLMLACLAVGCGLMTYCIARALYVWIALAVGLIVLGLGFSGFYEYNGRYFEYSGWADLGVFPRYCNVTITPFGWAVIAGLLAFVIIKSIQNRKNSSSSLPNKPAMPLDDASWQQSEISRKRIAAGVLAIVLGVFGVHKFYLGFKRAGLVMLVLTLAAIYVKQPGIVGHPNYSFLPSIIAIIGLIEGIIYLTKSDREFFRDYIVQKRAWF